MADNAGATAAGHRKRNNLTTLTESPTVGRFAITNHVLRTADKLAPVKKHPVLSAFAPQNIGSWLSSYLKNAFSRKHPFPSYPPGGGVYQYASGPAAPFRIGIAGDWATGTDVAQTVADLMVPTDNPPDLTIHLGDVYFVGDDPEVSENWQGNPSGQYAGVKWPVGSRGSFALNGNHEMFANGTAYFEIMLKALGQQASYFCLEVDDWRIIALDTGYNSVGIPILSQIPWINTLGSIGGDCHLRDETIAWLRDTVKPKDNPKLTLLLAHHQYFTAFSDAAYTKPAKQLAEFFPNQQLVWLWGHEHRMGIYRLGSADGGPQVYGRCVGHGGMPCDVGIPDPKKAPIEFYDPRTQLLDDNKTYVGFNGFVNASIQGGALTLQYRDEKNAVVLEEIFTADGSPLKLNRQLVSADRSVLKEFPPA